MGRFPQLKDARGSLKWTQVVVNECPELINGPLREYCILSSDVQISWLSPVHSDDFAEYRDQAFLQLLGVQLEKRPLETFWPNRGPQWDALGRTHSGELFLVESKAHISVGYPKEHPRIYSKLLRLLLTVVSTLPYHLSHWKVTVLETEKSRASGRLRIDSRAPS